MEIRFIIRAVGRDEVIEFMNSTENSRTCKRACFRHAVLEAVVHGRVVEVEVDDHSDIHKGQMFDALRECDYCKESTSDAD